MDTPLCFFWLQILSGPQKEVALALEGGSPLLAAGTPAEYLGEGFAHMLHDMKVIGHDAGTWQTELDRFAEGAAHIHADGLHPLWRVQSLQQGTDLGLGASDHHVQDAARFQIAEDRGIALAFASRSGKGTALLPPLP